MNPFDIPGGFQAAFPTIAPPPAPPYGSSGRTRFLGGGGTTITFQPGDIVGDGTEGLETKLGGALPGGIAALLAALGLGGLAAAGGAVYGGLQGLGTQFPWETGPGEGFIAPWTRPQVRDELGRWVTAETRPDLFGQAPSTAVAPVGVIPGAIGPQVVKTWSANGWPFAMTSDGKIHTVTKSGIRKSWRPYRSVVLGKKISIGMATRAMRKLRQIKRVADEIERLGGTRTVYRKAK